MKFIKQIFLKFLDKISDRFKLVRSYDMMLQDHTIYLQRHHPNPLNKFGKKCFSQNDEDGITLEIISRLSIKDGLYAEFGVEDGMENNTLILAALGWSGFWAGGDDLVFDYKGMKKFTYFKDWLTLDNIASYTKKGIEFFDNKELDVISLDLDGNDYYFIESILENGFHPKLFIAEYNAKFPPPVEFKIHYRADFKWKDDDYFGASLMSLVKLFGRFEYTLICCNTLNGGNAFFIKNKYLHLFPEVPSDINNIYVAPRYFTFVKHGHLRSVETVRKIFKDLG